MSILKLIQGVKQGDGFSVVQFILRLYYTVRGLDQMGTIFYKTSQTCEHADNIVSVARSRKQITEVYEELERIAEKIGLSVNKRKTKCMVMSTSKRQKQMLKTITNNLKYL